MTEEQSGPNENQPLKSDFTPSCSPPSDPASGSWDRFRCATTEQWLRIIAYPVSLEPRQTTAASRPFGHPSHIWPSDRNDRVAAGVAAHTTTSAKGRRLAAALLGAIESAVDNTDGS